MDHATAPISPEVSVLIAAWRAEADLPRAVRSALDQYGTTVEVVVVDDASPDATFVVARRLAAQDARVQVARLPRNGGPAVARNHALALARGQWVAVLDADDAMHPDRLARMLDRAGATGADVILGNLALVDATGRDLGPFLPPDALPAVGAADLGVETYVSGNARAAGGRTLGYLKPLIRRAFLMRTGIRYDPSLRNGEDYHLILACLLAGARVGVDPVPGYRYTRQAGSLSGRFALDHLAALIAAEDRLIPALADRPDLLALVMARRSALADLLTAETVLRAVKAGRIGWAGSALARRPAALALVLRQAGEGLRRRIGWAD